MKYIYLFSIKLCILWLGCQVLFSFHSMAQNRQAQQPWSYRGSLSMSLSRGNVSSTLLFSNHMLTYRKNKLRSHWGGQYILGKLNKATFINDFHIGEQLEYTFYDSFFVYGYQDIKHSEIRKIKLGTNSGLGVGYYVLDNNRNFLETHMGIHFDYRRYDINELVDTGKLIDFLPELSIFNDSRRQDNPQKVWRMQYALQGFHSISRQNNALVAYHIKLQTAVDLLKDSKFQSQVFLIVPINKIIAVNMGLQYQYESISLRNRKQHDLFFLGGFVINTPSKIKSKIPDQ